jgi:hypothetical protein
MADAATGSWRDRAPLSVTDPCDSQGLPLSTPADRRWLWRIESFLAVSGTNDTQRQMGRDLAQYLNETCEHHYIHFTPEPREPRCRQCIWCHETEWETANGWHA